MTSTTFKLSNRVPPAVILSITAFAFIGASFGIANADMLSRQLEQGMTGADVSTLQTFLATDITIYPQGLVTGFFGPLTFSAVSNFQTKNGISSVGRVGPITLAAINARLSGGSSSTGDRSAPIISGVAVTSSSNTATISWKTNEAATARVYFDVTQIGMAEGQDASSGTVSMTGTIVEPVIAGLQVAPSVQLSNLQPNTTYYYALRSIDASGNVSVTWPTTFKTQ
jgi:peptidoglycan hydrolase-like protein with peptidoglycan-binding domain